MDIHDEIEIQYNEKNGCLELDCGADAFAPFANLARERAMALGGKAPD
jgi:hypothetical protein